MPCWSIHLGVCKEVNKKFNYNKDLILFGSILPDLLDRSVSHYYNNHVIDFDMFMSDYKDRLDNPLIIGYYIHLLTDYYYNKFVLENSWINDSDGNLIGIKLLDGKVIYNNDYKYCRDFKQNDFKNYGNYLITENLLDYPKDGDLIYNNIVKLKIQMDKDKVMKNVDYFNTDDFYSYNSFNGYKMFDKETYDNLYKDCIDYIIDKINNM